MLVEKKPSLSRPLALANQHSTQGVPPLVLLHCTVLIPRRIIRHISQVSTARPHTFKFESRTITAGYWKVV